jgi:acyl-homoserine lactone acylase PvdQ
MGATAYFYWKESIYKIADEVPPERRIRGESRLGEVARQRDRAGLEPAEIPGVKLVQAVEEAAARLKADWGKVEVSWGEVFRAQREGSPRQYPIGGGSVPGMATPRAISFRKAPDGKHYFAGGGQTATQVVHLTQPPESFSLLPLGESDDPESPHFDDQAARLLQNRALKPTYFLRKEELLQHVTSTMVLERKR